MKSPKRSASLRRALLSSLRAGPPADETALRDLHAWIRSRALPAGVRAQRSMAAAGVALLTRAALGPLLAAKLAPADLDLAALRAASDRRTAAVHDSPDPTIHSDVPMPAVLLRVPDAELPESWFAFAAKVDALLAQTERDIGTDDWPDATFA